VYQPPVQAAPSQAIELTGAVPSAVTVNEAGLEIRPALSWALTSFGSTGSTAEELKL
jgi:hypothetical protein